MAFSDLQKLKNVKLIMLACANIEQKPCGASLKEASLFLNHWFENIPFSRHHI